MSSLLNVILVVCLALTNLSPFVQSRKSLFQVPSTDDKDSLCGEPEVMHSGYINELFYVFYESQANIPQHKVPVVLWLSGGPGCSGLIAMLFENGPCSVGEANTDATVNPFTWTKVAHVIYIDQPRGTGLSAPRGTIEGWKEEDAIGDLLVFVDAFFTKYSTFAENDLYIFGESYGGHYVPDIAHRLMHSNLSVRSNLRGIGIGNGLVSPEATYDTMLDYAISASKDFLTPSVRDLVAECDDAVVSCQTQANEGEDQCTKTYVCDDLAEKVICKAHEKDMNHYDLRAPCYKDMFQLCYKFRPLFQFVNRRSTLKYLGVEGQTWSLCNNEVFFGHMASDWYSESDHKVADLLNNNIRVLVYAGDQDLVCNWMSQEKWTREMTWKHTSDFAAVPLTAWHFLEKDIGMGRSYGGLTFLRLYNAGHVSL